MLFFTAYALVTILGLSHGFHLSTGRSRSPTQGTIALYRSIGIRIRDVPFSLHAQSDIKSDAVACPPSSYAPRKDNPLERLIIMILSWALARLIPDKQLREEGMRMVRPSFRGFCDVTKVLLRSTRGQPERIKVSLVELLVTLVPKKAREFLKKTYYENSKLLCEQSSEWLGFGLLGWLIGPTERISVKISESEEWLSGAKLVECRYLQESGCKSLCLHMCRGPTEAFFNEELGVPLRMSPNYDDCSCTFEFGLSPLPIEEDTAVNTPCYKDCSLARVVPCDSGGC